MSLIREIRRLARAAVAPTMGVLFASYFVFHLVQGDRGVLAWVALDQRIGAAEATLEKTRAERVRLAGRVELMRPDRLDRDMLDERIRTNLGLVRRDEIVVFDRSQPLAPRLAAE